MNSSQSRPYTQYHPLLTTPKGNSPSIHFTIHTSHTPFLQPTTPTRPFTNTFLLFLPLSVHNLTQTYIWQTYNRSQHPKHTTHIPHATLSLKRIHPNYLRNTLHSPCRAPVPYTIIYHYMYLSFRLRTVQHTYSLHFHTRHHHIFLLTKTSRFSDYHNSTLNIYPHHPYPYLSITHTSKTGHSTTTSYPSDAPSTTNSVLCTRQSSISLPRTDRIVILYSYTPTHNQHILLLVATQILLVTSYRRTIRWKPLNGLAVYHNIIRLVLVTLNLCHAHTLWK